MKIDGMIPMGAGDCTLAMMGHLYSQLGKAFVILGGMQQPPDPCNPDVDLESTQSEIDDALIDVDQIAAEIYLALTGRKIE